MNEYLTASLNLLSDEQHQLILMFFSAFLSSTILPGNSEIVFSALLANYGFKYGAGFPIGLFLSATIGNSLGSFTTYAIARFLPEPRLTTQKMAQWAITYSKKYGVWMLLFSWLPVVGDILCAVAGWLRLNSWHSLILITLSKATRYAILYWGIFSMSNL